MYLPNYVTLGMFKNIQSYKEALLNNGFKLTGDSEEMLPYIPLSSIQKEFKLIESSLGDLGIYSEKAEWVDVIKSAQEKRYIICPPEVGLALRLEYKDQANNDWLTIGMELIQGNYFRVANAYGHIVLDGDNRNPKSRDRHRNTPGTRLIFGIE